MDKKKGFFDKFKNLKGKEIIIAIIAVAIMLIIYFSSTASSEKIVTARNETDYTNSFQQSITTLVKSMSGDDNAAVSISWLNGTEKIIAYSESQSASGTTKTPTIIQSQYGNEPIVLKIIYPQAQSVAIVIKNGNETKMRLAVQQMVSTLLKLSPENVAVYSSRK